MHLSPHTQHTHIKGKKKKYIQNTRKTNTLTLVANVCVKQEAKQQQKNRQPELHQLTTKQTKEKKYYPTEKKNS